MLGGRIQALARAHDQITSLNWAPVALKALVESEAGAYLGARADRIKMDQARKSRSIPRRSRRWRWSSTR